MVSSDDPGLTLFDPAGKGRPALVVFPDGPALELFDATGRSRIVTP